MGTIAILILGVALFAMAGIYAYRERRHAAQIAEIINWNAKNAKACADIKTELEELREEFNSTEEGVDIQTAEKMWKQGLDNIMNYTLDQALGAVTHGRN